MGDDSERKAFAFRLGHRLISSLKNDILGLGWCRAEHLDKEKDWQKFKEIVRSAYPEEYSAGERALGNAAGSLWRFIYGMKVEDYVIVPSDEGFYVAEVKGDPFYDAAGCDDDFAWRRRVKWLTKVPVPRTFASNALQMRLKARQTCVDATDLVLDIEEALKREKPINFTETVIESSYEPVAKALQTAINNYGLEDIVKRLAMAGGARADIQPKQSRLPGDVDVVASYNLSIGWNQESVVKVAYQAKQHVGKSDEDGVKQIIDRMQSDPSFVRGCFVTTAPSITDEARKLADKHNIIVMTQKDLVEWVMMVGLGALR